MDNPGPLAPENRRLRAVVETCAERKLPLFAFCRDIEVDDLVQEGLAAVCRAAAKFDATAGHWSTFAYTVAARKMLDLWRHRSRQHARDQAAARRPVTTDPEAEDLAEYCARCRAAAHAMYGNRIHRVGPREYRVPYLAALLLLQKRLDLGPEAMRWLLARRKDLLHACGLMSVPSLRMFQDAAVLLARVEPKAPASAEPPASEN